MSEFLNRMKSLAKADVKTIVLPEGEDPRTIEAAQKLSAGSSCTIEGTVVAVNTRGAVFADATGYIYYYNPSISGLSFSSRISLRSSAGSPSSSLSTVNMRSIMAIACAAAEPRTGPLTPLSASLNFLRMWTLGRIHPSDHYAA